MVRPIAGIVSRTPLTPMDAGSFVPSTRTESPIAPLTARTVVTPTPRAVIVPPAATVATAASSLRHVTDSRGRVSPRALRIVIAGTALWPIHVNANDVGAMLMVTGSLVTVTTVVSASAPADAITLATPSPRASTRPPERTRATVESVDRQLT